MSNIYFKHTCDRRLLLPLGYIFTTVYLRAHGFVCHQEKITKEYSETELGHTVKTRKKEPLLLVRLK
jgi:hypothetical protein